MDRICMWMLPLCIASVYMSCVARAEENARSKRAPSAWSSSTQFNSTAIQIIVDQHNAKRRLVQPTASDMKLISWDEELATKAIQHSKKCTFEHANEAGVGENIYTIREQDVDVILKNFVDDWFEERSHFNFASNECKDGEVCGHYTQLVWAQSDRVGCGMSQCSDIGQLGAEGAVLICNYRPAGNAIIMLGGEPNSLSPYREGAACSECEEGFVCVDGLCSQTNTGENEFLISGEEADRCSEETKKMFETWNEQMRQWRDEDMERWRRSMEAYEEHMKNGAP